MPAPTPTADLYDRFGEALACCDLPFRHYGGVRTFAGEVTTVRSHEDNLIVKTVLAEPGAGRVLVVDTAGSTRVAMLGDSMARTAADHGWAGVIVHGAVRDVAALRDLPLGVVALGANPRRSRKEGAGVRDAVVGFGAVVFRPGDLAFADEDGVAILPRELAARLRSDR